MLFGTWAETPFFDADGGGSGTGGGQPASASAQGGEPTAAGEAEKTLTQDEANRIIAQRISDERRKWDAEAKKKAAEAERLAKLSAEEQAAERLKQAEERAAALIASNIKSGVSIFGVTGSYDLSSDLKLASGTYRTPGKPIKVDGITFKPIFLFAVQRLIMLLISLRIKNNILIVGAPVVERLANQKQDFPYPETKHMVAT